MTFHRPLVMIPLVTALLAIPWSASPASSGFAPSATVSFATPGGAVVFTFDDGYVNHLDAANILESRGFPGTFFIISQNIRSGPYYTDYMSGPELASLTARGHEIGSHSVTHADLTTVDATRLQSELADSKNTLQSITGKPVGHVAYPFGAADAAVLAAAQSHYRTGRVVTTNVNEFATTQDAYRLPALMMTQATTLATAKSYVDFARARGVTVILQFGSITSTPGAYDWTPSDLSNLVTYTSSVGVPARTMSQVFGSGSAFPPLAPTLTATATDARASLSWSTPLDGGSAITGYKVYRGTASGGETLVASLGTTGTYTDTAVTNFVAYYYQVTARNAAGEGPRSNEVRVVPRPAGVPGGTLVLTFDDGYDSQLAAAAKLESKGFRGTFFIPSGDMANKNSKEFMTRSELAGLASKGHDIEAHTINHVDLTKVSPATLERELAVGQMELRNLTGQPVRHLAYPFGAYNPTVETAAARYYASGRTIQTLLSGGPLTFTDPYAVPSLSVQRSTSNLATAKSYVDYAIANDMLVVLTFHRITVNKDPSDWNPADFNALIDYISSKGIRVQTYAQAMGG